MNKRIKELRDKLPYLNTEKDLYNKAAFAWLDKWKQFEVPAAHYDGYEAGLIRGFNACYELQKKENQALQEKLDKAVSVLKESCWCASLHRQLTCAACLALEGIRGE